MESDSFFYRLFLDLPQTLFELLGQPAARAKAYRFGSVELKKAFRIDGAFIPKRRKLPVYFVEVQFQRRQRFYANLFAKVFSYLEENDPKQDWIAVAIFPTHAEEPKHLKPYEDLLASPRVKRVYLDETLETKNPPVGLGLLQLLFASARKAQRLAPRLVRTAKAVFSDRDLQAKVIELVERLLMNKFPGWGIEEVRMKFKLYDIRKSKAWQELREEGREEGRKEGREEGKSDVRKSAVGKLLAKGMSEKDVSEVLEISINEVHRLANGQVH